MSTDLDRFVTAQDDGGTYDRALAELRRGRKTTHWMWFVFPQIAGLGRSSMAQFYALDSLEDARDYLAHPVLGPRLRECVDAILALPPTSADAIFGSIDAIKLRSSMTLFRAADGESAFDEVLGRYFDGEPDPMTAARL